MKLDRLTKKSEILVTIILIAGILVVVNFLSFKIFHRWDLTEGKSFSISDASKDIAGEIDDVVNINVYFSKNLPSQYIVIEQEVGDILGEYETYSGGKVSVSFVDPESLDNAERELGSKGIPPLIFDVIEKDKRQTVKGYLGLTIEYGGEIEAIPMLTDTRDLEYQVSMAIKKVVADDLPTVAFVSGYGSLDTETQINFAYKKLKELYNVTSVDLSVETDVPDVVDTLVVVGISEEVSENALKAIDAFVMRGGNLLLAVDGVWVDDNLMYEVNNTGLENLLDSYGLKLNKDLVLDHNSEMVRFTVGFLPFSIKYPLWPSVVREGLDSENPVVSKLESLSFAWASSIDIDESKFGETTKVSYLARTSPKAWVQKDGSFDLNPQQAFISGGGSSEKNLAVSVSGEIKSAYGDGFADNARIVLVGDSNFIADNFLQRVPDNLVFFQNIIDSLSFDESLINIRSKEISNRPIKELTDKDRANYRYSNVFGVTALVLVFGMFRYYRRRKKRFEDGF